MSMYEFCTSKLLERFFKKPPPSFLFSFRPLKNVQTFPVYNAFMCVSFDSRWNDFRSIRNQIIPKIHRLELKLLCYVFGRDHIVDFWGVI